MNGFTSDDDDPVTSLISSINEQIIDLMEERMLSRAIDNSTRDIAPYKNTITSNALGSIEKQIYYSEKHTKSGTKCLISQEDFIDGESEIGILPCDHYFGYKQLCEWLKEKPECPLCRFKMESEEIKTDVIENSLENFPTSSNLLNHILLLSVAQEAVQDEEVQEAEVQEAEVHEEEVD